MEGRRGKRNMASKNLFIISIVFFNEFFKIYAVSQNVTALSGETAELPCFCLEDKTGLGMKFIRPDRSEDRCVIFIRDGRPEPSRQLPEYTGRVHWTEDWVLLIENVTHEDEGTFTCTGLYKEPENVKPQKVQCSVHLKLTGGNTKTLDLKPGGPGGPGGWDVMSKEIWIIIIVFSTIGIFILIFFLVRKYGKKHKKPVCEDAKESCKRLFKCDYYFVKDECSS